MFYKVVFNPKKGVSYPEYATKGSSGCDLKAFIDEDIVIPPLGRKLIPTGLFIEMSEDTEAQIRPRSGLAIKHGITVLNAPGTIDSDYRGEICVILINLSDVDYTVKSGDKIAQMVFAEVIRPKFESGKLNETERGEGGFGHSGI